MPRRAVVRSDVHGVGRDGHWIREVYLLPAGGRLPRECCGGQERARSVPKIANVRAAVGSALIEANAGKVAVDVGPKRNAQLDWGIRSGVDICGNGT